MGILTKKLSTFFSGRKTQKEKVHKLKKTAKKQQKKPSFKKQKSAKQIITVRQAKKSDRKFLEENDLYVTFLETLVGKEGMLVVDKIIDKEITDGELSEKIPLRPNIIRKHLYAMYEAGVVTYRRHRSKTGWYTYFWKLHPERIALAIGRNTEVSIQKLERQLQFEKENNFFECENGCTRTIFEKAMEQNFKCEKCNETLQATDNREKIMEIERQIIELRTSKRAAE